MSDAVRLVVRAAEFAARCHAGQRRKGASSTPYINHLAEVAYLVALSDFGDDANLVAAAWLHDAVEDEHAGDHEIEELFGADIRGLVSELTDDMRLGPDRRKQRQVEEVAGKSIRARVLKLADKVSNVREIAADPPRDWSDDDCRAYAEWALNVVDAGCRGLDARLEEQFDLAAAKVLAERA